MAGDGSIDDLAERAPGEDPEDPYAEVDVSALPDWWAAAIHEFEAHGLRPFRPSRFEDGALTQPIIERLEREHDVDVRLAGIDAHRDGRWEVLVDGVPVADVSHRRSPDGYTVFGITRERFEAVVEDYVRDR